MTRDEAARRLREHCKLTTSLGNDWATLEVDKYVALGMLKLDEPIDAHEGFLADMSARLSAQDYFIVRDTLKQQGLKIVEKE